MFLTPFLRCKNHLGKASKLEKIAVIGSGVIGHSIAQLAAMAGFQVVMIGRHEESLRKGIEKIKWSLDKFVAKSRISKEDADQTMARIHATTSYGEAKDADFVFEAVPENFDLKCQVFSKLDSLVPSHAIFASGTSALSITEMGKVTKRPDKIVGMHFFNPPQQMELVEVIKGENTSQETIDTATFFSKKIGKTPIVVQKDVRGFIVNRIIIAEFNEAFWTFHRGEASKEGIDASLKYTGHFPMGWFELSDFAGLDVVYEVAKTLYKAYGERFKPCNEVIEPLVKQGKFGCKKGSGFYDWSKGKPEIPSSPKNEYDVERSWAVAVNEAAWLIYDGAANPQTIDLGMKLGIHWPTGPCEYADKIGLDVVLMKLKRAYAEHKMETYNPCPLLEEYVNKGWIGKKAGRGFY